MKDTPSFNRPLPPWTAIAAFIAVALVVGYWGYKIADVYGAYAQNVERCCGAPGN